MDNILDLILHKDDICRKREEINRLLRTKSDNLKSGTINTISTSDLKLLFQLYDRVFLGNWFADCFKGKIKFSLSRQMTKSAGLTHCPKNIDKIEPGKLVIEIKIGIDFFFHYDLIEGSKTVGGIKTSNSLEALQLVFEHELCHVIEFINFKKSSCRGKRFKEIAGSLFGHTESYHKLPTHRQIVSQKLGLDIGDTVSFMFEGKRLNGILYNINKSAIIMVPDKNGTMMDGKGNRYTKYYVPLTLLE